MKKHSDIFRSALGLILSLFMLVPFIMIILNSFKTKKESAELGLGLPKQWNFLENFFAKCLILTGCCHYY